MAKKPSNLDKRRLRSSNITVVVSIALVLFLIGITGLILINLQNYFNYLKSEYKVEVYLKDFVDKKDEAQVLKMQLEYKDEIKKLPFVSKVDFIDKKKAFEFAKKDLGPDKVNMIEENIFPASVIVSIRSNFVEDEQIAKIVRQLENNEVVDEVSKDDSPVEVYKKINQILIWLFAIAILFLVISIVLINNSIRLRIFSKRFIIKTMQLVGAKKSFIIKPFIIQALVLGLVGSVISLLLLLALWWYFTSKIYVPFVVDSNNYLLLVAVILFIGMAITVISTYFATRKFIKLRIDDLYYS